MEDELKDRIKDALLNLSISAANTAKTLQEYFEKRKQSSEAESTNEEDEWDLLDMDEGYDDDYVHDPDFIYETEKNYKDDDQYLYYLGEPFLKLIKERKPFEFGYCEEGKIYKLKIKEYEVVETEEGE